MPGQLPYVTCSQCGHVTEGGAFFDEENGSCAICDVRYEGCLSCSPDGQHCYVCKDMHHWRSTSGYGRCVACADYHPKCVNCS